MVGPRSWNGSKERLTRTPTRCSNSRGTCVTPNAGSLGSMSPSRCWQGPRLGPCSCRELRGVTRPPDLERDAIQLADGAVLMRDGRGSEAIRLLTKATRCIATRRSRTRNRLRVVDRSSSVITRRPILVGLFPISTLSKRLRRRDEGDAVWPVDRTPPVLGGLERWESLVSAVVDKVIRSGARAAQIRLRAAILGRASSLVVLADGERLTSSEWMTCDARTHGSRAMCAPKSSKAEHTRLSSLSMASESSLM
jgi:hypothetical protein